MAKLKDLAGLAALGMLGYKLSQGKGDASTTDTGDETSRLAARKPAPAASVVDRPGQSTISGPQVNPDANLGEPSNPDYSNEGRTPARTSTPAAKPKVKSPVGSGTRPVSAKNPNYSNEGRSSSAAAKNPNYSNEGRSSVKPTSPVATKPPVTAPAKSSGRVPTSEEAAANRQALYDKVTSGVGGYLNDTFTLEGRERAKKAALGMKRGGAVKKMAKGGMTSKVSSASSRADGIASRGKTKCKMY